ncbi:MAG TPA: FHA domain-containing protein [Pyrinomonadaceae bacterium]|nr:FHA domain-containing protein [Pyrinomonadaceae bacterium]
MSENKKSPPPKKSFSPDWLVRGILAKLGESFDKLTGRNWKPSSSLATSELIERLKKLLDAKVRDLGDDGRFVPHNIKLKMQWDKFSTDAEKALEKLRIELHAAAIDHINDNRYHTYAPIKVEVTPDYFTEGVNLHAGFEKFGEQTDEEEEILKVTMPNINLQNIVINPEPEPEPEPEKFLAAFKIAGKEKTIELAFKTNQRRNVGRTKENDLTIDDPSVSKIHASLVLNAENQLMVADTGSTNGTFVNEQRIAYGKAMTVNDGDRVKFGTVEVFFRRVPKPVEFETRENYETPTLAPETRQIVISPQAVQTPQNIIQETAAVKQNPAPKAEQKPAPAATDVYKTSEEAEIYKTGDGHEINNGASPAEDNRRDNQTDGDKSQIFQTEQRINFDFGDEGNKN